MTTIFEHDSREAAQSLIVNKTYLRAGLYETDHLYEYLNKVG